MALSNNALYATRELPVAVDLYSALKERTRCYLSRQSSSQVNPCLFHTSFAPSCAVA